MSPIVVPRWRQALVAAALVGGLLALHGLTQHGEHLPTAGATGHTAGGHGSAAPDPSHDDPTAIAWCVAMVLGAVTGLIGAALRRRPQPVLRGRRQLQSVVRPPLLGRAHGPPNRWVLSVCRC